MWISCLGSVVLQERVWMQAPELLQMKELVYLSLADIDTDAYPLAESPVELMP